MPPGITVDLQNLEFFDSLDTIAFIFSNFVLLHDFKRLMFLNGPIFLISSYFLVLAEVENASLLDPNYDGKAKISIRMNRMV